MSATRPGAILRHLHPADPDDAALLARYAGRRDPAAFAALVRRHGPVVLAVCRRVTGHPQDAEDAFQAAFLVLARSAGSVRNPDRLGSWLYGVAVKVAGRARRAAGRRRRREVTVAAFPDVPAPDPAPPPDVGPALHEELAALPALHREPIVLCDLQGLSRTEAAKALGIAEGTLSSRLANGRKRLAERLTRRGVALSLAALPAAVAGGRATVPDELVSNTCGLAAAWAAGAPLPAAVVRLARGGFPMRGVILGGVLSVTLAAGAVLAAGLADTPRPADPPRPPELPVAVAQDAEEQQPKKADAPAKFGPPRLTQRDDLPLQRVVRAEWSPDGAWLVVWGAVPEKADGPVAGPAPRTEYRALVVSATDPSIRPGGRLLPPLGRVCGFTADSRGVLMIHRESGLISGATTIERGEINVFSPPPPNAALNPKTVQLSRTTTAEVPADTAEVVAAADGQAVYALGFELGRYPFNKFGITELDVKTLASRGRTVPVEGTFRWAQLTQAGRVVTVTDAGAVEAYGVRDGKRLWSTDTPAAIMSGQGVWNPMAIAVARDGSRILALRGRELPVILDGHTGKTLMPLEGAEEVDKGAGTPARAAVSADGRLAALVYTPVVPRPDGPVKGGKGVPGTSGGFFPRAPGRLTVWDTATGKVIRSWTGRAEAISFHPTRPVLAILEANGSETRLGLWEFRAE